jgi:hypothetical protein
MMGTGAGAIFVLMVGTLFVGIAYVVGWVIVKVLQSLGWILGKVGRLIGWGVRGVGLAAAGMVVHVSRFVRNEVVDGLHTAGGLLTAAVIAPLALLNLGLGRFSAARHYGVALEDEVVSAGRSFYRLVLGNPIRFVGLSTLTAGLENRVPGVIDRAPREPGRPSTASFPGYKVLGTLAGGGSGARLYVARPAIEKLTELSARGHADPGKVVIKSFALEEGSTLPDIVRETRALECASRLGLVLEHELSPRRFHYVMPYVPGDDLGRVTSRMHAHASPEGLDRKDMALVMGYAADLLRSLHRFHTNGLWHKDIKPNNLIVSDGRVHVVDLGLVTPLQSAMTLTTHGTEYYRDPEMVRLALRGVKVHEVDGVKFDLYSTGAVLYSMIENSFPAHGSLSRLSKKCPEALAWIVRRAMADLSTRYGSAREMLVDLETLCDAKDAYALLPADLPSVKGVLAEDPAALASNAAAPVLPFSGSPAFASRGEREMDVSEAPVERSRCRRRARSAAAAVLVIALSFAGAGAIHDARARARYAQVGAIPYPQMESERVAQAIRGPLERVEQTLQRTLGATPDRGPCIEQTDRTEALVSAWDGNIAGTFPRVSLRHGRGSAPRVLVLETPTGILAADSRAALEQALQGRGFHVLGADPEEEDLADDATAAALHAIGLGDPSDAEAVERLQSWVDDNELVDRLVWCGRCADGKEACLLFRPREAPPTSSRIVIVPGEKKYPVELR